MYDKTKWMPCVVSFMEESLRKASILHVLHMFVNVLYDVQRAMYSMQCTV